MNDIQVEQKLYSILDYVKNLEERIEMIEQGMTVQSGEYHEWIKNYGHVNQIRSEIHAQMKTAYSIYEMGCN